MKAARIACFVAGLAALLTALTPSSGSAYWHHYHHWHHNHHWHHYHYWHHHHYWHHYHHRYYGYYGALAPEPRLAFWCCNPYGYLPLATHRRANEEWGSD